MTRLRLLTTCLVLCCFLSACSDSRAPAEAPPRTAPDAEVDLTLSDGPAVAPPAWVPNLPTVEPGQVAQTLALARQALARGQLERGSSPGPGALELYWVVSRLEPANEEAKKGLQTTVEALLAEGALRIAAGDLKQAERIEAMAIATSPEAPLLAPYRKTLAQAHGADALIARAQQEAEKGHVLEPAGTSARDLLQRALKALPDYAPARQALARLHEDRLRLAWKAASAEDFTAADGYLLEAQRVLPGAPQTAVMDMRIVELRQALTGALIDQGNAAVDNLALDQADETLAHLARIAAQPDAVEALRERIHLARHYGPFKPAQAFAETLAGGGRGPEMVVVPYGRFDMGSPEDEAERTANENPVHAVVFARGFAIARSEVTVAEFRRFIVASGYRPLASRTGRSTVYDEKGGLMSEHEGVDWRRDHIGRPAAPSLPVMHVAFEDAQAYAAWLSKQTGQRYRLPSEAEFEYVLRGGSKTAYPWGAGAPDRLVGNLTGEGDVSRSGRRWANAIPSYRDGYWGAAPVRSFPPEKFGAFDLTGNLSEWTLDCWHESYQRAPVDGSAWVNPGCEQRVVRGASWGSSLDQARSAFRLPMDADTTGARLGFRVVREL